MRIVVIFILVFVYSCDAVPCGCEITSSILQDCSDNCENFEVSATSIVFNNVNITAENIFIAGSGGVNAVEISITNCNFTADMMSIASADTDINSSTLNTTSIIIIGDRLVLDQTDITYTSLSITLESTSSIALIISLSNFFSNGGVLTSAITAKAPRYSSKKFINYFPFLIIIIFIQYFNISHWESIQWIYY